MGEIIAYVSRRQMFAKTFNMCCASRVQLNRQGTIILLTAFGCNFTFAARSNKAKLKQEDKATILKTGKHTYRRRAQEEPVECHGCRNNLVTNKKTYKTVAPKNFSHPAQMISVTPASPVGFPKMLTLIFRWIAATGKKNGKGKALPDRCYYE
jgi:hypothetical protein